MANRTYEEIANDPTYLSGKDRELESKVSGTCVDFIGMTTSAYNRERAEWLVKLSDGNYKWAAGAQQIRLLAKQYRITKPELLKGKKITWQVKASNFGNSLVVVDVK